MLSGLTKDGGALRRTLATQPPLAYGTRIHDAMTRSLGLLRDAKLSSGSIVLLSDGADIGSVRTLEQAVAAAKEQQVRIFTVGLRSGAFDPAPLRSIAERTGGSYAEARSAAELAAIYEELGAQLAGEYLVRYRSAARPMSQVEVEIEVAGAGTAPRPTSRRRRRCWRRTTAHPSRRSCSPAARRSCSPSSSGCSCADVAAADASPEDDGRRPRRELRERVPRRQADNAASVALRAATRNRYATGWWAELERDLELARMTVTARQVVGMALAGTFAIFVIALLSRRRSSASSA